MEAVLADRHKRVLRYLQNMDAPTYQYARYWDWIKPWVENEVQTNRKNQHIKFYRAELELSINVLSLIEEIEHQQAESGGNSGPIQAQAGDVIRYAADDGGPQPYVIWEIQS